ncbi:MAG: aminodeoxychorismate/anthranilate synthase component II [Chitinophagales bacterium]
MLLLLDNYDSFTYNLQDYFLQLQQHCLVIRNDEMNMEEINALHPSAIIISPGPETPSKAGIMLNLIHHFHAQIPILGICLGHQGIGEYFGATLDHADKPMHGKTSVISHHAHPVFQNISNPFIAMRYHSLLLKNLDRTPLQIIAESETGEPMAIAHHTLKLCGIQFHPESILTPDGLLMLNNWLRWSGLK